MILSAVVDGETDPGRLASYAAGRVRASQEELERALTGKVTQHHRFMLGEHLKQIDTPLECHPTRERGNCPPLQPSGAACRFQQLPR
jgi:hypothetical protein